VSEKQCSGTVFRARGPEARDERPRGSPGRRVHAGRRFVEHQHLRPADEGQCESQPLLLAAGQDLVRPVRGIGQANLRQQRFRFQRRAEEGREEPDHLAGPGLRVDAALLEHQPHFRTE
jgi:hypothetical protein